MSLRSQIHSVKECISCLITERGSQGMRDGFGRTQHLLFGRLGFVADSQLLGITIARAYKGRSGTLTTEVFPEITVGLWE